MDFYYFVAMVMMSLTWLGINIRIWNHKDEIKALIWILVYEFLFPTAVMLS